MTEWYQPSNKVSLGLVVKMSYELTVGEQRFHLKDREFRRQALCAIEKAYAS